MTAANGEAGCGTEAAGDLVAGLLAAQAGRLPADIDVYARGVMRILAPLPEARARAAVAALRRLGGLPSRAEVAAACGAAGISEPR